MRGRAGSPPVVGAVRRTVPPVRRRARHVGKLSAALVLVTTGILAATTGTTRSGQTSFEPVMPSLPDPTFFFDDAADALAERRTRLTEAKIETPGATAERGGRDESAALASETSAAGEEAEAEAIVAPERTDGSPSPAPDTLADRARSIGHRPSDAAASDSDESSALAATDERATVRSAMPTEREIVVKRGDTLSGILNDHGVRIDQLPSLLANELVGRYLLRLEVGQKLDIAQHAGGEFRSLSARIGPDRRVTIGRDGKDLAVTAIELPLEKERVVASGTIEHSLYVTAAEADLKQSTIMSLADIFQWELDFARDIRRGDRFAIVYDRLYREGIYVGDGDILAAEFERGGRQRRAIRFTAKDGTSGYYAPDGTSMRRTFMRHPVDIVRITSKFDPNRLHPVLHQIRAHRGVDYGAPHGSPIRATADGVVKFSGPRSSYGNTVILQHGERTKTLYAHMSRISDKSVVGSRVRQGDVIGYVGNTGRVTGTHLHYEFRVDDKHVDPLTVELPAAAPLAADQRDALQTLTDELVAQMRDAPSDDDRVAVNDIATPAPVGR